MSGVYFVGNSHVAALKLSQRAAGVATGGYFGASGQLCKHMTVKDGRLVLDIEGGPQHAERIFGLSEIPLSEADAFVLVGLSLSNVLAFKLFEDYTPWAHEDDDRTFLSEDCFEASVEQAISRSRAFRLARALRDKTSAPIVLVEQPAVNELVNAAIGRDQVLWRKSGHFRALLEQKAEAIDAIYRRALSSAVLESVEVVMQPAATRARGAMTAAAYAVQPRPDRAIKEGFMARDYGHANASYGEHVWRALIDVLPSLVQDPVAQQVTA